jgi:hypothetical protein
MGMVFHHSEEFIIEEMRDIRLFDPDRPTRLATNCSKTLLKCLPKIPVCSKYDGSYVYGQKAVYSAACQELTVATEHKPFYRY